MTDTRSSQSAGSASAARSTGSPIRGSRASRRTPCVLGCGRLGEGPRFVKDLRMPGMLVTVAFEDHPWFVCDSCMAEQGHPQRCVRCGFDTHVTVGSVLRCARCAEPT